MVDERTKIDRRRRGTQGGAGRPAGARHQLARRLPPVRGQSALVLPGPNVSVPRNAPAAGPPLSGFPRFVLSGPPNPFRRLPWTSVDRRSLPENAYRKLKPGESYGRWSRPSRSCRRSPRYSLGWGLFFAATLLAAAAYLGLKIGQVFEAAIPITILAIGVSAPAEQEERAAAARDDPVHRLGLGRGGGRRHLHPAGHLHPGPGQADQLPADVPGLAAGRLPGHPAADPLPALLRQGHARGVPLPRGHRVHRGAGRGRGRRRPGRRAGAAAAAWPWLYQLFSHQTLGVWRETFSTTAFDLGPEGLRQVAPRVQHADRGCGAGPGLHHRPAVRADHRLRVVPELVGPGAHDRHAGQGRAHRRHPLRVAGAGGPLHRARSSPTSCGRWASAPSPCRA